MYSVSLKKSGQRVLGIWFHAESVKRWTNQVDVHMVSCVCNQAHKGRTIMHTFGGDDIRIYGIHRQIVVLTVGNQFILLGMNCLMGNGAAGGTVKGTRTTIKYGVHRNSLKIDSFD